MIHLTYGGVVSENSEYKFIKESLFDLVYSCSGPDSLFHMDLCLFLSDVVTKKLQATTLKVA